MPKKSPSNPNSGAGCNQAPGEPLVCPLDEEYELVELIEVVTQDAEKFVKGAADETADKKVVTTSVERKDKDGVDFKQYINLDPLLEGQAKCHPEYGRIVRFRARVKQKSGATDKLAGVKVVFECKRTDGPQRADPGGTEPAIFSVAALTAAQQEGFGGPGGGASTSSVSDANGWTSAVELHLSEFAGDRFEVSASLDAAVKGAGAPPKKTKALYRVWRKFWYQMTYAKDFVAQRPTAAESAYAELFAEMVLVSEKKFEKGDLPADLQDRTFMKEYQLKQGGSTDVVANVGADSNIDQFVSNAKMKLDTEPEHPVKGNLIVCEYQCDPKDRTQLKKYKLTSNHQSITLARGAGGPIVCKPPIKAGARLVVSGEWSATRSPWHKGGDIVDADIEIDEGRSSTLEVKVKLPAGAPTPSVAHPVWVRLQLETAAGYLGWAADGGIVAVYQPKAIAGTQGSLVDFNDTTAHEFGHKFRQTPEPAAKPDSLKDHPLQYLGHGGSGSHCRHAATVPAGAAHWQDENEETPTPADGDCIMFASYSSKCSHKFCVVCKTYLQLEPMKSI
ncbi:MAG: hypothetical protein RLY71_4004 [Pseudomonadota bacterium]|jgi:hypothetical protein